MVKHPSAMTLAEMLAVADRADERAKAIIYHLTARLAEVRRAVE